jgi:dTDP-4-amino-4,6-dideoxygalactose transaminase
VTDSAQALGAYYKSATDPHGHTQTFSSVDLAEENPSSLTGKDDRIGYRHAGVGARAAVFSFNGNKIITTSGGGMLVSDDENLIEQARFFSQQARDPAPHYEHTQIGYNYRMSNILAAIGRGQLRVLDERVKARRRIFDYYRDALDGIPRIEFMHEAPYGKSNRWLTIILITPEELGVDRETVRRDLK